MLFAALKGIGLGTLYREQSPQAIVFTTNRSALLFPSALLGKQP
jgi:hypothetical protein